MATNKIKLKKKKTDSQQPNESIIEFVARAVEPISSTVPLDSTEEEVTTFSNLIAMRSIFKIDNMAFRQGLSRFDEIKGGASSMDDGEKSTIGANFAFANPMDLINEYPDVRDRIEHGASTYHTPSIEARKQRFRYASSIIYNTVNPSYVGNIIGVFITPQTAGNISLWTGYVEFGLKGTQYGDSVSIMDYIKSVAGTIYDNNGLREHLTGNIQSLPGMLTVDQILNAIENVLINGITKID